MQLYFLNIKQQIDFYIKFLLTFIRKNIILIMKGIYLTVLIVIISTLFVYMPILIIVKIYALKKLNIGDIMEQLKQFLGKLPIPLRIVAIIAIAVLIFLSTSACALKADKVYFENLDTELSNSKYEKGDYYEKKSICHSI